MSKSKVLVIMTGSIACYKACQAVSRLIQKGYEVQVVATSSALKFVGNATIEGLTGKPVISDLFAAGNVMDHIHLARWADLILVAPATAHYINKAAHGLGDDLSSTLFLAHDFKKPLLLAPAMNTSMYLHPATQESVQKLTQMGVKVLESASGILACGETGFGRLLEPDQIVEQVEAALSTTIQNPLTSPALEKSVEKSVTPIKVLVTAGGTQESIDDVRVISNLSTGQTGYKIARLLVNAGYDITLLRAESAQIPEAEDIPTLKFTDFDNLNQKIKAILSGDSYTHVIHAAAVSDFSVSGIYKGQEKIDHVGKMDSGEEISIRLKPNPKIISLLKSYSRNPDIKVIGFKLTSHVNDEMALKKVEKLFQHADYVIHNDLKDIDRSRHQHRFTLWNQQQSKVFENVEELSMGIIQVMTGDSL